MPTIIDKLRRYPAMNLTTMQDIAGIRAIVGSVRDAYKLAALYRGSKRMLHELIDERDYIKASRDEDGYRSIHLIYSYRNSLEPQYNGLRVELQIRSKLQHTWATAVETMGTLLGQALKSRRGSQAWLDFFALVSSAFAHQEKTSLVPRFGHLDEQATIEAVRRAEASINALVTMSGVSRAVEAIAPSKGSSYHLIVLDSLNRSVRILAYDRASIAQATDDYTKYEKLAAEGEKIEPVLVSVGSIDKIRRAYPSFFLDIQDFMTRVRQLIGAN